MPDMQLTTRELEGVKAFYAQWKIDTEQAIDCSLSTHREPGQPPYELDGWEELAPKERAAWTAAYAAHLTAKAAAMQAGLAQDAAVVVALR